MINESKERKALRDLVALKDMRERAEHFYHSDLELSVALLREYGLKKDAAWTAARAALAQPEPEPELPPLPPPSGLPGLRMFSNNQMRSYGLTAILADRKRREG